MAKVGYCSSKREWGSFCIDKSLSLHISTSPPPTVLDSGRRKRRHDRQYHLEHY